jgi:hypothetical protein
MESASRIFRGPFVEKAVDEFKQLFLIGAYFWLLIGLFTVFKALVLKDQHLFFHEGFAVINAWILAKVVLVAEHLKLGEKLRDKPLIYPIIFRAALFCLLLIGFYMTEETVVGVWHGKTIIESFPEIGGGSLRGTLIVALILLVGLIPFFSYRELSRALGDERLYSLLFRRGPDALPIQRDGSSTVDRTVPRSD